MPEPTFLPDPSQIPQDEYGEHGVVPLVNRDGDFRTAQRLAPKLNLANGFQISEGGLNPKRTIVLTAGAATLTTSDGAPATKVEYTGGGVNMWGLDYDQTSQERAEWTLFMPSNYDSGPLMALVVWSTTTSSVGTVVWGIQGKGYNDGDNIDTSHGTAVTVSDDNTTTENQIHISNYCQQFTLGSSPGPDRLTQIRVYRDVADSRDNLGADARLIAVKLLYGISKYGD